MNILKLFGTLLCCIILLTPIVFAVPTDKTDKEIERGTFESLGQAFQTVKSLFNKLINIIYLVGYIFVVLIYFLIIILMFYIPIRIYRDYYIPNRTVINKLLQLTRH
jgi:hypothetical protein